MTRISARTLLARYAVAWLYLAGFVIAEVVYAALSPHDQSAVLQWASTNVVNLRHDPVGSLAASMFISGAFGTSWPAVIALALFGANRALGNWRTALVCVAGHVIGTLVSEGIVDYRVTHGLLPASRYPHPGRGPVLRCRVRRRSGHAVWLVAGPPGGHARFRHPYIPRSHLQRSEHAGRDRGRPHGGDHSRGPPRHAPRMAAAPQPGHYSATAPLGAEGPEDGRAAG